MIPNKYNTETGEQIKGKHCPNLQCEKGCEFAGHQWGKWFNMQPSNHCTRCGYKIHDFFL